MTQKEAKAAEPTPEPEKDPLLDVLEAPTEDTKMPIEKPKKDEKQDQAIEEIAKEEKRDALDDLYDKQSAHEEPMLVIADEKHKLLRLLKNPRLWLSLLATFLVACIFVWLITPSRLWVLNAVGLRAQLHVATLVAAANNDSQQSVLKNTTVKINSKDYKTDDKGKLSVALPYGSIKIEVTKPGYETMTKNGSLDFDPFFHALGGTKADQDAQNLTFALKSVGIPVTFSVKDWLTDQPVVNGKFTVGDVEASPTSDGQVSMVIPATDAKEATVQVTFDSVYADTAIKLDLTKQNEKFVFMNAGKDYFISKRTGNYGIYSSALDGTNVAEVVPGSVNETGDISFSVNPKGTYGVLASTRQATKDGLGSLQQKLYIVELATGKLTAVDTALTFSLADWSGDTLIYTASEHATGGETTGRVATVDVATGKQTTLASPSGFETARVSLGNVVYLTNTRELRTVRIKGGGDKSLGTGVTKLVQTEADRFAYQTDDDAWHKYNVNADQVEAATTPTTTTRVFLASASADGQTQLVVDTIDGKRALIGKKVAGGQEIKLYAGNDLTGPIRWVGNIAVYRVGSADYVVSPNGGQPKKITDVTATPHAQSDYFRLN